MASTDPPQDDDRVRIISPAESVPVFNCVVHLKKNDQGRVQARIANIDADSIQADSERDALKQAVEIFKQIVGEYHASGKDVPLRVPDAAESDEQTRLIAVHL